MSLKPDDENSLPAEARIDILKAELLERKLEIDLLSQQCRSLEDRIQEMHASNSWRLTAPVRAISGMLKTCFGGRRRNESVQQDDCSGSPGTIASELPDVIAGEDTFALYRIVGNDLPPRHRRGQSLENLRFILDHEPDLEDCEKAFVLNRILDEDQEQAAIDLLEERGFRYFRIPFDPMEYKEIGLDEGIVPDEGSSIHDVIDSLNSDLRVRFTLAIYRHKNRYVMNVNGARNAALADGRNRARWILPWDGNCFLTQDAWRAVRTDIAGRSQKKYFIVPMARMLSNEALVNGGDIPEAVEEPQIIFRADAAEQFNPSLFYGHRDKVELLWRLGVQGPWTEYHDDPWDPKRVPVSDDAALVGRAGWVARLFSGKAALEKNTDHAILHRGMARSMAIMATLQRLDADLSMARTGIGLHRSNG